MTFFYNFTVLTTNQWVGYSQSPNYFAFFWVGTTLILIYKICTFGKELWNNYDFFAEHSPLGNADQGRRSCIEIANEKRRMNEDFQILRTLLPHHEEEKLSNAAILHETAEYMMCQLSEKTKLLSQTSQLKRQYSLSQQAVEQLEQEKERLLSQNSQLTRLVTEANGLSQQVLTSASSGNSAEQAGLSDNTPDPRIKEKRFVFCLFV